MTPILHVSQVASILRLPAPAELEAVRAGWDIAGVLDGWIRELRGLDWAQVTAPTQSRRRSLRNLTVNVFRPVGLLPEAWTRGGFDWDPDEDPVREAALASTDELLAYAEAIWAAWCGFLLDAEEELAAAGRLVESPRGQVTYAELLASQRWHADFHYRELLEFVVTVRP